MDNDELNINQVGKTTDPDSALNFDALRAKGIELIQGYSGYAWSDFNLHDPGVTILEHLSYAITDLAYRTNFDIRDILTGPDGKINAERNLFYARKDILSTNPVTINDLRKLILDSVTEVYNVWIEKIYSNQSSGYIKGLYKVVIQLFEQDPDMEEQGILSDGQRKATQESINEKIISQVKNVVLNNRNLGEDYVDFSLLKPCVIEVDADIVVDRHALSEEILAEVYVTIRNTLNPPIHFYSETDLFAKGYTIEEMYSGPALQHGFIEDAELDPRVSSMATEDLAKSTRARVIDPSDILKSVSTIPGVLYVRNFRVRANGKDEYIPFRLALDEYAFFSFRKDDRSIRLMTENNEIPVRESLFLAILNKKTDYTKRKFIKGLHESNDPAILNGVYRNVAHYFSFQHLFPPVYRLNIDEIEPPNPPHLRNDERVTEAKAKAKQLKAYLMFFEQILANYLAQLANTDKLLSADVSKDASTYFTQPLYEVPGAGNILKDFYTDEPEQTEIFWSRYKQKPGNGYMSFLHAQSESSDVFKARKNKILDHLMSRFNLNIKKYPVMFFMQLFYPDRSEERESAELKWKSDLLKNIVLFGKNRNQAYNYQLPANPLEGADSGFETLMYRLLYIQNATKRKLSNTFDQYMNRFSLQERDYYVTKSDKPTTSVPVEWGASKMEILIDEEEMKTLLHETEPETGKAKETKGLIFPRQNISFLKDGLDLKNYRIGPDIDQEGFILVYKSPAEKKWTRAGRFDSWQSANDALSSLLDVLRKFNIESEGFHVVEHILLRPSLESKYFGFNFYDEKGHVLFYQNQWTDFREREDTIDKIFTIAKETDETDYAAIAEILNGQCRINYWKDDILVKTYTAHTLYHTNPELAKRLFDKMIRNIRTYSKKRMTLYPGIENMVNRLHDADIREDFFHFRMTVVLPKWPTRFQDEGFRAFTENLFREHTPAHIKLQFKWLGIGKMKKFETLYFDWRESMQGSNKTADDIVKSDKLISFINDGIYSIM